MKDYTVKIINTRNQIEYKKVSEIDGYSYEINTMSLEDLEKWAEYRLKNKLPISVTAMLKIMQKDFINLRVSTNIHPKDILGFVKNKKPCVCKSAPDYHREDCEIYDTKGKLKYV